MAASEDAENERRSQGMVDAQRPVRYWQRRLTLDELVARVDDLERRLDVVERRRHDRS